MGLSCVQSAAIYNLESDPVRDTAALHAALHGALDAALYAAQDKELQGVEQTSDPRALVQRGTAIIKRTTRATTASATYY